MSTARSLPGLAGQLAVAGLAFIVLLALPVWVLGVGHQARQLLGLSFAGPARDPAAAVEVAATNMRLIGACLIAAWAVRRQPRLRPLLDLALATLAALNLAAVGVALGAYGDRLLQAIALHAPFELVAFALGGGAYLAARGGELSLGALVVGSGLAVALVAAGALVETYVQLGAGR